MENTITQAEARVVKFVYEDGKVKVEPNFEANNIINDYIHSLFVQKADLFYFSHRERYPELAELTSKGRQNIAQLTADFALSVLDSGQLGSL